MREYEKQILLSRAPDDETRKFLESFFSDPDFCRDFDPPMLNGEYSFSRLGDTYLMPKSMVISKKLDWDTKIYHFMPLVRFVEMLDKKLLFFKRVTEWEDSWEIPYRYLHLIKDEKNREIINAKYMYGTCWTSEKSYDTDAMWRIYSKDKQSICFSTTISKLFSALTSERIFDAQTTNLFMAPIYYVDLSPHSINRIIDSEEAKYYPSYMYPAFLKRDRFSHESEIRLLLFKFFFGYNSGVKQHSNGISIPLNHVNFVNEVILDPRLNKYEEHIQRSALEAYRKNIGSIRKSSLYTVGDNFVQSLNEAIELKDEVSQGMPAGAQVYTPNEFCSVDAF